MWPFKTKFITPDNWRPLYYVDKPGSHLVLSPGTFLGVGGNKVPKKQSHEPLTWRDMDDATLGQCAMEALMGLFSVRGYDCREHFWCQPANVMTIAECYRGSYGGGNDKPEYIGIYLWPVVSWDNQKLGDVVAYNGDAIPAHMFTTTNKPQMKILMSPLPDGRVGAIYGGITPTDPGTSWYDQGVIDPANAQFIHCCSRRIDAIPFIIDNPWQDQRAEHTLPPAYVLTNSSGLWHISRCWETSETSKWLAAAHSTTLTEEICERHS